MKHVMRFLCGLLAATCLAACLPVAAQTNARSPETLQSMTNTMTEWTFTSAKDHTDPFNQVEVDAVFTDPSGATRRVPAFWAGGKSWKVRYASSFSGKHTFKTVCSDPTDAGLHGIAGVVQVTKYRGSNKLLKHGPVRVAADKRRFVHADGTPFFWLGDTWWMSLCKRISFRKSSTGCWTTA
jgi:hypothetical protein